VGTTDPWTEAVQRACLALQVAVRPLAEFL
jgi:hypothetical protein